MTPPPDPGRGAITVALIGGDGSGKTTVAELVVARSTRPARYLYLGSGFRAQNVALPTTRLLAHLKTRAYRKKQQVKSEQERAVTAHDVHQWSVRRGRLAATAIMLNRIADETYRSLAAWVFRRRGFDVVCDRHFLFEYAPQLIKDDRAQKRLTERIHLWFVESVCPRPDLFVFLDAPPEVLVARTPELTLEQQVRFRNSVTTLARTIPTFVAVDATRTPDQVAAEIAEIVARRSGGADWSRPDGR